LISSGLSEDNSSMSCALVLLVTIDVIVVLALGGAPALILYLRGQGLQGKSPSWL
jgi:hypothetical protein